MSNITNKELDNNELSERILITQFVEQSYIDVLERNGDWEGINHWVDKIIDPSDPLNTKEDLDQIFMNSQEYKNKYISLDNQNPYLLYGNCQLFALNNILNFDKSDYINCHTTNISKSDFTKKINKYDVIITQPIKDNYRDKDYLSTDYIIKNRNNNCKIIIFDSCYFNFYYFDLTYKNVNNKRLEIPTDYHYKGLVESYTNNLPSLHYIENYIDNFDLIDKTTLEKYANDSLIELKTRYESILQKYKNIKDINIISIHDYVKENYKDKLLFYTMNHPSKYVLQYICEEIIKYLNISNNINYDKDPLNFIKCIIYKCVKKAVNFDIDLYQPFTLGKDDVNSIVDLYYKYYSDNNIKFI